MLRVEIHSQDFLALSVYIRADIDSGGGLSNPAFARDKRDNFTHRCYLQFHSVFRVVLTLFGVVFRGTMYLIRGECAVIRLRKPLVLLTFSPNPIRIRVPEKQERALCPLLFFVAEGTRKDGPAFSWAKIESWRAIFNPWESPQMKVASCKDDDFLLFCY